MEEKKIRKEFENPLEIKKKEEQIKKEFPKRESLIPKEPPKRESLIPKRESKKEDSLVKSFLNKDIVIMMRGERKLMGRLETVSSYELLVTINYSPVIVLKHAVDYITLFEEKEAIKEQVEPLKA